MQASAVTRKPQRPAASSAPIVVIGASGAVGGGVVEALLEAGLPVLAIGRDAERLAALRERVGVHPLLALLPGSVATDADGAALVEVLRRLRRPLGGVVLCIGGARRRGRLLDQPMQALDDALREGVLPHLVAARHLLPMLVEQDRRLPFLVVGGPAANCAWAGYGHLSVNAAALRMLVLSLRLEVAEQSVRIQQLAVGAPVRTADNARCACPEWPSAHEVGRRVCALLAASDSNEAVVDFPPSTAEPRAARPRLVVTP